MYGGDPLGARSGDTSNTVLPRWREMARPVNGYAANLVAKWLGRFGHFGTLPLRDVDGAFTELEYSLDTLRADAMILLGN
jgi:6-methylsalicylate decarboxylase